MLHAAQIHIVELGNMCFMSQLIHSLSSALAHADQGASSGPAPAQSPCPVGRPDSATAQCVQVGLVLNAMLGQSAASAYLARQAVNERIAQRVLSEGGRHRSSDDATRLS
jgi:hypothetical protein